MNSVILIEATDQLFGLEEELSASPYLAVDTESNSFHAYFERICLIQLSTAANDYILDPHKVKDLHPLAEMLRNPELEKVLHAASNDILGLRRDFGFEIQNLFDTAVACKLLGHKKLGLAGIIQERFGTVLNKKWQRHDWSIRPLRPEQLDYARLDTHYLIPLRHMLAQELEDKGLSEAAREAFERTTHQRMAEKTFRPEAFRHIRGARLLDSHGRRILKALYIYREREAQRRDRAPFRILTDETLLRLAWERPQDIESFSQVKGLPRSYREGNGAHNLLSIIRRHSAESKPPSIPH